MYSTKRPTELQYRQTDGLGLGKLVVTLLRELDRQTQRNISKKKRETFSPNAEKYARFEILIVTLLKIKIVCHHGTEVPLSSRSKARRSFSNVGNCLEVDTA